MNNPESDKTFVPRQALSPTPQLYDELVGDGMENLAKATVAELLPITSGAKIHDNGCGTGAGTAAIAGATVHIANTLKIHGTDINDSALEIYKQKAAEHGWPAEAALMDSNALSFPDDTFSHSINTAFLFVLPGDGIDAVKETYRTLTPGGTAAFNSWAYVPNMDPIQLAAKLTRPEGTPLPRRGMEKWEPSKFLQGVVEKGGFDKAKTYAVQRDVFCTTTTGIHRYATMLWSFIGGTSAEGWLQSDEDKWDEALKIVETELRKTDGFAELEDGRLRLKFTANIVIATK
jgi:ubiquinone/menaquinone biosynthesis C-methylase UbiE